MCHSNDTHVVSTRGQLPAPKIYTTLDDNLTSSYIKEMHLVYNVTYLDDVGNMRCLRLCVGIWSS